MSWAYRMMMAANRRRGWRLNEFHFGVWMNDERRELWDNGRMWASP